MATFAVQYTYIDDAERVGAFRPEHRAHLAELHSQGVVALSGPLADGAPGALVIVRADSADAALAALDADPFWREQVIAERTAREWTVVVGELPEA